MKTQQQYYCMRFYVTYGCNSRCKYCNVWRDSRFRGVPVMAAEEAKELIRQAYGAGVRYIDFTGGEPTLVPHLAELVRYAGSLGIKTEVTSNAADGLTAGLTAAAEAADKFNISLDTLDREKYIKIRGRDSIDNVKAAIKGVAEFRLPKLMTAVSDDNSGEIDSMIRYAREQHAEIYLNPVFPYFGKDPEKASDELTESIRAKIFDPYTVVMLHFLEFIKASDSVSRPPCSANVRTLTFAPDGSLVLPCYHKCSETLPWNGDLEDMLRTGTFRKYAAWEGSSGMCRGCAVVPYFGISFGYRADKWFLFQSYSEKLHHLKRDLLNNIAELEPDTRALTESLDELTEIINSFVPDSAEPGGNDCWQLENMPHRGFDDVCRSVYRSAYKDCLENGSEKAFRILESAEDFQLSWWKYYISVNMNAPVKCDEKAEMEKLLGYFSLMEEWSPGIADRLGAELFRSSCPSHKKE